MKTLEQLKDCDEVGLEKRYKELVEFIEDQIEQYSHRYDYLDISDNLENENISSTNVDTKLSFMAHKESDNINTFDLLYTVPITHKMFSRLVDELKQSGYSLEKMTRTVNEYKPKKLFHKQEIERTVLSTYYRIKLKE